MPTLMVDSAQGRYCGIGVLNENSRALRLDPSANSHFRLRRECRWGQTDRNRQDSSSLTRLLLSALPADLSSASWKIRKFSYWVTQIILCGIVHKGIESGLYSSPTRLVRGTAQ